MAGGDPNKLKAAQGPATATRGPTCPRCKSKMILRTARQTGTQFWGCTKYPDCRGTYELTEARRVMDRELADIATKADAQARKFAQEKKDADKQNRQEAESEFLRIQRAREKDSPW